MDSEFNVDDDRQQSRESSVADNHDLTYSPGSQSQTLNTCDNQAIKPTYCCEKLCMYSLSPAVLESTSAKFSKKSAREKSDWILNYLLEHSSAIGGKYNVKFVIATSEVCEKAWMRCTGVSKATFYRIRKKFTSGNSSHMPHIGRLQALSSKVQTARAWILLYAMNYGDKQPDHAQIHLPMCCTKRMIYRELKEDLTSQGHANIISKAHFYKLWKNKLNHIRIPKVSRFSICDKCAQYKLQIEKTQDKQELKAILSNKEKHLGLQNDQRQKYYKHCQKARRNPQQYLSMIIDGMDQSKTFLPKLKQLSKQSTAMWKLKVHLTGVIMHGIGMSGYFDFHQYPHNSNLTINIILRSLAMLPNGLPPTLYIQMDNCGRENKNRFILALASFLVEKKLVKKVKIGFLMVGHTHEDVDQLFSRFAVWLLRNPAETLKKLMAGFEKCYTPNPTSIEIDDLWDFSSWLNEVASPLQFHSKPHCFKFVLDTNGRAKMMYKIWATDKEWLTPQFPGSGPYLLTRLPTGTPEKVEKNVDNLDLPRLAADVQTSTLLSPEDRAWWNSFLNEIESEPTDGPFDLLENLSPAESLEAPPRQSELHVEQAATIKQVVIGRKKPKSDLKRTVKVARKQSNKPNSIQDSGEITMAATTSKNIAPEARDKSNNSRNPGKLCRKKSNDKPSTQNSVKVMKKLKNAKNTIQGTAKITKIITNSKNARRSAVESRASKSKNATHTTERMTRKARSTLRTTKNVEKTECKVDNATTTAKKSVGKIPRRTRKSNNTTEDEAKKTKRNSSNTTHKSTKTVYVTFLDTAT